MSGVGEQLAGVTRSTGESPPLFGSRVAALTLTHTLEIVRRLRSTDALQYRILRAQTPALSLASRHLPDPRRTDPIMPRIRDEGCKVG